MARIYSLRKYILFFFALLFFTNSYGQSAIISGKITDENNEPLTGAVAELRSVSDSSLEKVNVADAKGLFAFDNPKAGKYYLKTSLLGFAPYNSEAFAYDGTSTKEIATIKMGATAVALKEANVTAIKPLIEVHADKTVFNVENSINSTGSTAYELLQKAPAVVVDNNDNISLKGRGGVLVQIDGRDTHLSQEELGTYLKSIQSTEVESIELISNPSSKYAAQGTAGIINIKLKKNKSFGTNGSVTAGYAYGAYSKYNTALSLNNRNPKFNFFGNYSNNWGTRESAFYLRREQDPLILDAGSIFTRWGLNQNYKAGVDYSMNSKNTIGMMVNGSYNNIEGTNESQTIINNYNSDATDSILTSNQTVEGHANGINLNLNHHFADTLGHDLATDFDFGYYDGNRDNYQPNIYTLPGSDSILSSAFYRTVAPTTIHIYTFKSDYTQNFLKGKLGAGYKLSFVNTDNTFKFYNIENNIQIPDSERSNHFVYTENVYALYLNYQRTINKFDFQAGVRMENTASEGILKSATDTVDNKDVKRNYVDYFPSAGITYNANKDHSLALIYSKRIDRPNYQELNPFVYKLDDLSFRVGNPFLNPQYSDKVEVSHTYKYTITTSIGYSHTKDYFAQITDTLSGGRSYITSRNLATEDVLSLDISGSLQPTKWYGIYFSTGLYNQAYDADFPNGKSIHTSVIDYNLYAQNTIKFPDDWTLEISGWYNSGGIWGGTYVNKDQGSLDLGLQKKIFHEQGTFKLSYTDILHTAPWAGDNVYGGINIHVHGHWESQQFRASLTWRFGNNQVKALRQRSTGNETEQKRIGGDN